MVRRPEDELVVAGHDRQNLDQEKETRPLTLEYFLPFPGSGSGVKIPPLTASPLPARLSSCHRGAAYHNSSAGDKGGRTRQHMLRRLHQDR